VSARTDGITGLAERHRRVAVDSNVLIYLLEDHPVHGEAAAILVDAVAAGDLEGVIASLALVEVLTGAARADDGARFEQTAATLRDIGFSVAILDADAAEEAAWLRGRDGLSAPDAVHLACASAAGATAFVTNDRRIRSRPGIEVVPLEELAGGMGPGPDAEAAG
jgi:predicted nucleic acid-binding protein